MKTKLTTLITVLCCLLFSTAQAQTFESNGINYSILEDGKSVQVNGVAGETYPSKLIIPSVVYDNGQSYSVTVIRDNAFMDCANLISIYIPNSVTFIGDGAFAVCINLTSINIPNSVTSVGDGAFSFCEKLTNISISDGANLIFENGVFYSRNKTRIISANNLTEYFTLPNSVTSIGNNAFMLCENLISINIPNSVTSIGYGAFAVCINLTSINIPNSVTSVGDGAFSFCEKLTDISISDGANLIFENGVFYNRNKTRIISANNLNEHFNIPNSVTSIGDNAFMDCSNLTSINIPNSVTFIGDYAFYLCSNIESINIPNSVTSIGDEAFGECENLQSITASEYLVLDNTRYNDDVNITRTIPTFKQFKANLVQYEPFIKEKVEKDLTEWQIKGEFETTSAWQTRVNENTRTTRIQELTAKYKAEYLEYYNKKINTYFSNTERTKTSNFLAQNKQAILGQYDADNQCFLIKMSSGDILLPVPISKAQAFKSNWQTIKNNISPVFVRSNDGVVLNAINFPFAGEKYTYDSNVDVEYAVVDVDYNFDPISLDLAPLETNDNLKTVSTEGLQNRDVEIAQKSLTAGTVLSDVMQNIPTTNVVNANTFVLIIANENYTTEQQVQYALNDGRTFKKYCERTLGIPSKNIRIVEDATVGSMSSNIGWLRNVLATRGNAAKGIVYYSGHGIPNEATGDAYLLPTDITGADFQYAYSLNKLYKELGNTGASAVTYFIDACFSGAQRDGGMMLAARGVAIKAKSGALAGNSIAFTAASGDETAFPYKEKGHGIFTYFLLKKLQETKGQVSYGDLADYIRENVVAESQLVNPKQQTPSVIHSNTMADKWMNMNLVK